MSTLLAEPWRFRMLGGSCHLLADHDSRAILLTAMRHQGQPVLATRAGGGWLEPLTADHQVAKRIEECVGGMTGVTSPYEFSLAVDQVRKTASLLVQHCTALEGELAPLLKVVAERLQLDLMLMDSFTEAGRMRLREAARRLEERGA